MQLNEKISIALKRFHFSSGISWNLLPPGERLWLKNKSKRIKLKRKESLFKQGDFPHGIYFLKSGKLKVYQLNYDGTIQILFIYGANEVFGYRPILSNEYQPVSISAIEDCELLFVKRNAFLMKVQKSAFLSNQLLVSLCHEFTVLTNRINVFAQRGTKERLALALLILNEIYKLDNDSNGVSEINLTRTDLANFVGTSLENLGRTLNYFKEKKLIRTKGKCIFITHFENIYILSAIG